jgi:glycosyltransferase involved in cell wall biosynthesis
MRILFVTDYPPEEIIGGSVRVLYEQSTRLANREHDIHVLTRKENFRNGFDIPPNIIIWKYATNNKNSCSLFASTYKNSNAFFEKLLGKFKYDLINFHQPFSAAGLLKCNKSTSINKIYTCHSLSFEEYWSRNIDLKEGFVKFLQYKLNGYLRKGIERYVLNKSNKIIVLSQYMKTRLSLAHHIPDEKCHIAAGGVDLKRFRPSSNKFNLRTKLNIPQNKIILFTVRNLVRRMGLANLITALKDVAEKCPNVYLVIGGEGPLKNKLLSLTENFGLSDYIRFAGFIDDEILPEYYQSADIFVLPTKELEGFGLVTLEALASGLPVLGTSVGGTREILEQLNSDFIFDGTGPHSMARKILKKCQIILNNPKKWKEISLRCRRFTEANYSWEKNVDELEELFS